MQVWPKRVLVVQTILALALGGASALAFAVMIGPHAAFGGPAVAAVYLWGATRRYRRRKRVVTPPFPDPWRRLLARRLPYYRGLDDAARARFEDDIRIFLAEQRIYGLHGVTVREDTRVLVGAAAAMLVSGMPDWEWPEVRDIVVYPSAFDEQYRTDAHPDILGMVHMQGPILLSQRDVRHGFHRSRDGENVALHELAHVIDMADGHADGVPAELSFVATAPWVRVVADRLERLRGKDYGDTLREYAGTNETELFAVAVEAFFETPVHLREHDPELYAMLRDYFGQDPEQILARAAEGL